MNKMHYSGLLLASLFMGSAEAVSTQKAPIKTQETPVGRSAIKETVKNNPVSSSPQEEETRLTKNWGGTRTRLSEKGLDLALIYKFEYNQNFEGGMERGSTTLGNLDFRTNFDLNKMMSWKGGKVFFTF